MIDKDFPEIDTTTHEIEDLASTLNNVNFQVAELLRIKEDLEKKMYKLLLHSVNGSRTYGIGKFSVTVTTGFNYVVDKEKYAEMVELIPDVYNPIRIRTAYDIDKKMMQSLEKSLDKDLLEALHYMIKRKDKKLHIRIGSNC
jgi:hypothetical protein